MPNTHLSGPFILTKARFYDKFVELTHDQSQKFRTIIHSINHEELLAITLRAFKGAQLRVASILSVAKRFADLNGTLPFEVSACLYKNFLKATARDTGIYTKITFAEYLYYSIHYENCKETYNAETLIPTIYNPAQPFGRVLGGHIALEIVLLTICQANARRLNETEWLDTSPDMDCHTHIMHILLRNQLLTFEDVQEEFERIMLYVSGFVLDTVRTLSSRQASAPPPDQTH
ncbi:hypothetical protein [Acetobacter syzygii]|uniref:Uncharacterized protein n=1 Tax=Acetobacter syzygii TaxID=146476 RepID=A0A270BQP4_9PROT|nr:hypothetical protein [Acetobacter syzygii]NSL93665.1 hypothetical protein [Acetobacter syzygii]PAL27367.1 hypothetical protein B9K05_05330 [Acetobacter syzygii]PAL27630.1 hypothetical protein B9K04_02195 [Acetobacter syzygii]GAN70955.1 hypothetical protein Absy_010_056 [Acetobacter syzygii]GBR66068.1 hypothetical protein AA0483_2155 [Acetobacter syzygii NRIC 0483]